MQKLDRIFQSQDVNLLRLVELIDHRAQRGGLAGAGSSSHENDSVLFLNDLFEDGRQAQFLEGGNLRFELAHDDGAAAVLAENIHPETSHFRDGVAAIARTQFRQIVRQTLVRPHDVAAQLLDH